MEKITLSMRIPNKLSEQLELYAKLLNIKKPASIAYILKKQISLYNEDRSTFNDLMKNRRYKSPKATDNVDKIEHFERRTIKVSIELHDDLFYLANKLNMKNNELIINLIRNEFDLSFNYYVDNYSITVNSINCKNITNIPMSDLYHQQLTVLSDSIGISINMLASQIIGDYIRENYKELY